MKSQGSYKRKEVEVNIKEEVTGRQRSKSEKIRRWYTAGFEDRGRGQRVN